jgi:hypothetical protein
MKAHSAPVVARKLFSYSNVTWGPIPRGRRIWGKATFKRRPIRRTATYGERPYDTMFI